MPGFKIEQFSGEAPRINPRTLTSNVAELALDVDLSNGTLKPWRERLPVYTAPFDVLAFMRGDCCWLAADVCADYSLGWPSCPYVIRTGVAGYPEMATFADACLDQWCRLGPPCPDVAPSASPVSPPDPNPDTRSLEMRAYRYSWVNKYDQEGGGSPPSLAYTTNDGTTSIVQLPPCPSPEWCVTAIRIYRLSTPLESGAEKSNPQNTEYYLVAEVPCGTTVYTDTQTMLDLGGSGGAIGIFTREEALPAPADLTALVCLENGMLAGISGEFVVMSEPFQPGSWPLKYWKRLWDTPIALAAVASTIYVGTTGRPYTIDGRNDCNGDGLAQVHRHREPLPITNKRSMVAGDGVAYYASVDGLVALSGAQARVVSESIFSRTDWQALHPNLMLGALLDGFYFGFTDVEAIRLKTPESVHTDSPREAFTRLSDRPVAVWTSPEGQLFMAEGAVISQWNGGAADRQYRWRSIATHMPRTTSINAALADIRRPGNVEITHISDRCTYARRVWESVEYRLPASFYVDEIKVEFVGTGEMASWAGGTSVKEARRVSA